jgi:hypothetical protein
LAQVTALPKMPLNKVDLRRFLGIWAEQPDVSIASMSSQTGLSRQRVSSAKQWAILSNLLDFQGLTDIGKLALEKDPYLEATVTDWVIHFFSSLNGNGLKPKPEKSSDWGFPTFFIYDFLSSKAPFTQEELVRSASQIIGDKDLEASIKVWLKTYLQKDAIRNCQFLTYSKKSYVVGNSNLQNSYTVGYLLANIWQRDFGSQNLLLVSDLIDGDMGLCEVLGIQEPQLREHLDRLAELDVIEQRSAKPHKMGTQPERRQQEEEFYIVARCWDTPLELLSKAYEQDPVVPNRPLLQSLEGIFEDDDEELPFLSSVRSWLLNLGPQQSQLAIEHPTLNLFLHLAS